MDSAATGANNGTSWANAWANITSVSAVSAGDTVYISGGGVGTNKTYSITATTLKGGSAGNRITYQIGQEAGHNGGTATFISSGAFVTSAHINVSGDAGDGVQHFVFGSGWRPYNNAKGNMRISYVNCGDKNAGFYSNGGTAIEIDHCYFRKTDGGDDFFAYLNVTGATWDVNKIHDNEVHLIRSSSGTGDDGIQAASAGVSIYNNRFYGYQGTYTGGQHQDGYQPLWGSYIKVYGNYFENIANYPIFGDAYYGDFTHFWVYHNVIVITDAALQATDPPQGIAIGPDGGAFRNLGRWPSFTDVVVANNLIVDYGNHQAISLQNNAGQSSVFTDCVVANNISLNSSYIGSDAAVTNVSNVKLNLANGTGHFVRYAPLQTNNNFHLVAADTTFRDKGTSLSYFSIDSDGIARPQGTAWDIGPYELNAGTGSMRPPLLLRTASVR